MFRKPTESDYEEWKKIWTWIAYWKKKTGISLNELADRTGFPKPSLAKGLNGEAIPVRHAMRNFVEAFGITSGRIKSFEDTTDILTDKEVESLLEPREDVYNDDN